MVEFLFASSYIRPRLSARWHLLYMEFWEGSTYHVSAFGAE